jgi:hypothetical protein
MPIGRRGLGWFCKCDPALDMILVRDAFAWLGRFVEWWAALRAELTPARRRRIAGQSARKQSRVPKSTR